MLLHEIKTDIKNNIKKLKFHEIPSRSPLRAVGIPSHSNFLPVPANFAILNTHALSAHADPLSFSRALSKMASSSVESCQISYLTWVKNILEKDALDIPEV